MPRTATENNCYKSKMQEKMFIKEKLNSIILEKGIYVPTDQVILSWIYKYLKQHFVFQMHFIFIGILSTLSCENQGSPSSAYKYINTYTYLRSTTNNMHDQWIEKGVHFGEKKTGFWTYHWEPWQNDIL